LKCRYFKPCSFRQRISLPILCTPSMDLPPPRLSLSPANPLLHTCFLSITHSQQNAPSAATAIGSTTTIAQAQSHNHYRTTTTPLQSHHATPHHLTLHHTAPQRPSTNHRSALLTAMPRRHHHTVPCCIAPRHTLRHHTGRVVAPSWSKSTGKPRQDPQILLLARGLQQQTTSHLKSFLLNHF
jgi:hypothetical protein